MLKKNKKKLISIFGATGSVGLSTQEIIKINKNEFKIDTIVCNEDLAGLINAAKYFKPNLAIINNNKKYNGLKDALKKYDIEVASGNKAIIEASKRKVDILVAAISGFAGLNSTFNAIGNARYIALANKESIVCAGPILLNKIQNTETKIIPIDSEHNTLYQILDNTKIENISRVIITGSGGPFRGFSYNSLNKVSLEEAINHPIWKMGKKISIDSATLMNKGLELIEAAYLFNINQKNIDIIIHPESIIHGIVEYKDGSMNAGLSMPDMKSPISFALNYPNKIYADIKKLDLTLIKSLNFEEVDTSVFKSIEICRSALNEGHASVISLNAINEVAVNSFIKKKINFNSIMDILKEALNKNYNKKVNCLEDIILVDKEARNISKHIINSGNYK
ncbi:MAG: 1-deoxy-D-xylulose 5-phosphate reductoisomerase [Alphaproteobacteria bacterium MarineAlpha9_Bin3]|nr:MAG: 1-deoxy-D-xylulose 5-phosphate reductoisomerase [Alphaproteobacteria bacterium MarineAlpha9_Bin3]|tara:strand:+ start:12337 stop:13515 length:1179 start_codon:yes stop_codon:yes gene_type:complete